MKRNRKWLKGFLNLGIEHGKGDCITLEEVKRQEETVLHALDILDKEPGVVLADEVGMGKTFEALGVMACFRNQRPKARMIVITPGPDLNRHWIETVKQFSEKDFYNFDENDYGEINRLSDLPEAVKKYHIIFTPISIFSGGRNKTEQEFLLNAYFRWAGLHRNTRRDICKKFFNSVKSVKDVTSLEFMDTYSYWDVCDGLDKAFQRSSSRDKGYAGLHDLYHGSGTEIFRKNRHKRTIFHALDRARFHILNKKLPIFDLLVVDEAHKLKNPWTLRSQAVSNIFFQRYRKTLFLTATPFQLGVYELEQVYTLFSHALNAPRDFLDNVKEFFEHIKDYQQAYNDLETDWRGLNPETAANFSSWYARDPDLSGDNDDTILRRLASTIQRLKKLKKDNIEPGFRRWMIRSLKEDAHEYRKHKTRKLETTKNGLIPFLIYERMLLEIYRQRRSTYKATVEINMSSSFEAARTGSLLVDKDPEPNIECFRKLLNNMLYYEAKRMRHPKVADVVQEAIAAMLQGDKTLIFCERIETIRALRKKISNEWNRAITSRWRKLYPDASDEEIWGSKEDGSRKKGKQTNLQSRFRKSQDALYLALRENYIYMITDLPQKITENRNRILFSANRILSRTLTGSYSSKRLNYRLIKRCVEQAVFRMFQKGFSSKLHGLAKSNPGAWHAANSIISKEYVQKGLDLELDDEEGDEIGTLKPSWRITEKTLNSVLSSKRKSIWLPYRKQLNHLDTDSRVRLVEGIASFLTRRQVTFLLDLLEQVKERKGDLSSSADLRDTLEDWWNEPGNSWRQRVSEFINYFLGLNPSRRNMICEEALKSGKLVSDTLTIETRERIKEAFNTPFYPIILIGNRVMQEGLDLHRNCRRIIHHDLAWNPAQLEQRVGRIDRIGSLTRKERGKGNIDCFLEIYYPLVQRSIDIRLFQVVKEREKWLNFLLGTPPNSFDRYNINDHPSIPIPQGLAKDLTVKLQPE